jgi:putative endonuclease
LYQIKKRLAERGEHNPSHINATIVIASDSEAIQYIILYMFRPAVYIMTNMRNGTLYVGVTSNLPKRIDEHKRGVGGHFTSKYHLHTLVYAEYGDTMEVAIMREKQLKGGSRKKKIALIESINPTWEDISSLI